MLLETNQFSRFIWWIKNASIVLTYYYSNVKAHANKRLKRCPKSSTCELGWKKKMVRTNTLASQVQRKLNIQKKSGYGR